MEPDMILDRLYESKAGSFPQTKTPVDSTQPVSIKIIWYYFRFSQLFLLYFWDEMVDKVFFVVFIQIHGNVSKRNMSQVCLL